jgi:hypothetical protein
MTLSASINLNIQIPQNPNTQIANLDVIEVIKDKTVIINKDIDYLNPQELTYSYVLNWESDTDTQFLPRYVVILDSENGLHGLMINWELRKNQPTSGAIGGTNYHYQGSLGDFVEAPWVFTASSVLENTPEIIYHRNFSILNLTVTVNDRTLDSKTNLIDRWVIAENHENRDQIESRIISETSLLEIYFNGISTPELVDLANLDHSLVLLNIPSNLFITSAEGETPRTGLFTVEWVLTSDALYERYGLRHPQLRLPVTLQVIESRQSNND